MIVSQVLRMNEAPATEVHIMQSRAAGRDGRAGDLGHRSRRASPHRGSELTMSPFRVAGDWALHVAEAFISHGCNSDAIRDDVQPRGGQPEIPTKRNRRVQHLVNRRIYARYATALST